MLINNHLYNGLIYDNLLKRNFRPSPSPLFSLAEPSYSKILGAELNLKFSFVFGSSEEDFLSELNASIL